jgi:hypothetical protein
MHRLTPCCVVAVAKILQRPPGKNRIRGAKMFFASRLRRGRGGVAFSSSLRAEQRRIPVYLA